MNNDIKAKSKKVYFQLKIFIIVFNDSFVGLSIFCKDKDNIKCSRASLIGR